MDGYVTRNWRPGHTTKRGRLTFLGEGVFRACNSAEVTARTPLEGDDPKALVIGGYFSTSDPDIDDFVIHERGWEAGLDTFLKRNPRFLWMHDPYTPIGNVIEAGTDARGLRGRADFDPEDDLARKLHSKVQRGYLGTFSVGFRALDEPELIDDQLHFNRMQLMEVSLVTIPANINAGVTERAIDEDAIVQRMMGAVGEKFKGAQERVAQEIVERAKAEIDSYYAERKGELALAAAKAVEDRVGTVHSLLSKAIETQDRQRVLAALDSFKLGG